MSEASAVTVNLDIAVDDFDPALAAQLRPAVGAALKVSRVAPGERAGVNIRIVDRAESQRLNQQFRAKASPTNVLAFPVGDVVLPEGELSEELGNLAICLPVVRRESLEQAKSLESHLAHMVIHGTLHLLGYDHANDAEAEVMEELERVALKSLGFPDPYQPSVASVQSK